jgi:hypothetical protein
MGEDLGMEAKEKREKYAVHGHDNFTLFSSTFH